MSQVYEVVIGLEVHAQLKTATKLFCGDTTTFGMPPNTQVSAISLGHPGTLPRLNTEAIGLAVKLGLACNCTIVQHNYFARKNYFYPDLPKGYQISQHTTPICQGGFLEIGERSIRLNRIHMEEDAGKSIHDDNAPYSQLDYNRAGMPLLEIVTEPDLRSADEAFAYVTKLRKLVRHLNVCDGNMEEGSLRCDVNISVRPEGESRLGTKVEIKNLNSIRFIKKAIEHEKERLIGLHSAGKKIVQETRGFDEATGTTYSIRVKEDEDDYRYFPEPDLPPFYISTATIDAIRESLPPLPEALRKELIGKHGLSDYDAGIISNDPELTRIFHALTNKGIEAKPAANWTIGPVKNAMTESEDAFDAIEGLAQIISVVQDETISYGVAVQKLFPELLRDPHADITGIIASAGLSRSAALSGIDELIDASLTIHSQKITEYKKGKKGLLSLFVGEVMKLSHGKADAKVVTEKILEKLNAS